MKDRESTTPPDEAFLRRAVEATIRIGLVLLLIVWCFEILRPFIIPVIWGLIIAIAAYPAHQRLARALRGRSTLAAVLIALLGLLLIIVPAVLLADTLVNGARQVAAGLAAGTFGIPPPPAEVASWPLIGQRLFDLWSMLSSNAEEVLREFAPQLKSLGGWFLGAAAGLGFGVLQFALSIVIAGALLATAKGGGEAAHAVARRLAGRPGPAFADLAKSTIRNVTRGILGVALIQAVLAGLGLLAAGVPAAGLLAIACLMLAVIQIGVGPVLIPAVIYVFYAADTLTAVLFLIWSVFVLVSDNVLKPLLLGRGADVPMLVIFLGAIGGFLSFGIIGLFVGAVGLSLGYTLFKAWLAADPGEEAATARPENGRAPS